jgi:Icc protein
MLLAHLADTHLSAGILAGPRAERGYQALARIQALRPRPRCVVLTGDLAEHGTAAEYECARALPSELDIPSHVVPGNHDHAPRMLQVLAGSPLCAAGGRGAGPLLPPGRVSGTAPVLL